MTTTNEVTASLSCVINHTPRNFLWEIVLGFVASKPLAGSGELSLFEVVGDAILPGLTGVSGEA